jgi:RNA polymerase sigma-70 factor (ECF subfamily)
MTAMALTVCAQDIFNDAQVGPNGEPPEKFWESVEQYRHELISQAQAILGNREDAEDVVQETFCEVIRNRSKLKDLRSLGAWLRTVNQSNALDRLRHRKRESKREIKKRQEAGEENWATGGFSLLETRELVTNSVEKLPSKMRAIVIMCYWDHLSPDQIAERLDISPRTVRRVLLDALLHLYASLNPHLQFPKKTESTDETGEFELPAGSENVPPEGE